MTGTDSKMNAKQRRKINRCSYMLAKKIQKIINDHITEWEHSETTKEKIVKELRNCINDKL